MLADQADEKENQGEVESDEQGLSEEEELGKDEMVAQAEISALEAQVTQKEEELKKMRGRVAGLEQELVARDENIATLEQSRVDLEEKCLSVSESLAEAVASYKALVIERNPEVMEELISGDTITAINESLEKAKKLIGKVKQGLETEMLQAKVPAGAPERRALDVSALSPREKIQYAIEGRQ